MKRILLLSIKVLFFNKTDKKFRIKKGKNFG